MNLKNNHKAEMAAQTIFYILMSVVFIGILIFGFQKIFEIEKNLSDQERIEIKKYMKESFEYCEDPLNSGNFKTFKIDNNMFNVICILGEDALEKYSDYPDLLQLYDTSQNVIILDTNYIIENEEYILKDYFIVDSIKMDTVQSKSQCYFKDDKTKIINVQIKCD